MSVAPIADGLKYNSTLRSLNMSGLQVGTDGLSALADALSINGALTHIGLNRVRSHRLKAEKVSGVYTNAAE